MNAITTAKWPKSVAGHGFAMSCQFFSGFFLVPLPAEPCKKIATGTICSPDADSYDMAGHEDTKDGAGKKN